MTFLLAEDKALRERLMGMTVTDQKATGSSTPRQVGVFYGQPDQEIRTQAYPYVTIDMIEVARDPSREMRGIVSPSYMAPSGLASNQSFTTNMPVPVTIDYQITTYARHPRHDREIIAQLMYGKLPPRFGALELDDNTIRRMDVENVSKRDVTEQAKRLYVNAVTVRVSSEIPQGQLYNLYKASSVVVSNPDITQIQGRTGNPYFTGPGAFTIS